eukprot:TRINITY_DN4521_c2_g1_i1.p1 TRINITY_DN4521_c2_g1~~TRINITY_DN4521_c2_g1_i1.p1  ORF type:complete len:661 (+),score=82.21 TRINITY_DN4521_c2_g1_i1:38-1984(+)
MSIGVESANRVEVHHVKSGPVGKEENGIQFTIRLNGKTKTVMGWEDVAAEKTLGKISKWAKMDVTPTHEINGKTNAEAWDSGNCSLTFGKDTIPVFFDPPVVSDITLSNEWPMQGVPLKADATMLGTRSNPLEVRYMWSTCDDGDICHEGTNSCYFTPTEKEVGKRVGLTITCYGENGFVSTKKIEASKDTIPLHPALTEKYESWKKNTELPSEAIRIGSYNILADMFAAGTTYGREVLYPYVERDILDQRYRFHVILKDIIEMDCDIISLQESGNTVFKKLLSVLSGFGYDGWHLPKIGTGAEGCAVFWKTSRFTIIKKEKLPLGGDPSGLGFPSHILGDIVNHAPTVECFKTVVSVAQFLEISDVKTGKSFAYCNTHLYFRPYGNVIRALQLFLLYSHAADKGYANNLILTGDLNTVTHSRPMDIKPDITMGTYKVGERDIEVNVMDGVLTIDGVKVESSIDYDLCKGVFVIDEKTEVPTDREFFDALSLVLSCGVKATGIDMKVPRVIQPPCAYRMIDGGVIKPTDPDWRYTQEYFGGPELSLTLSVPFSLRNPNPASLRKTIFTPGFGEVLDYTLYSPQTFQVAGTMSVPAVNESLPTAEHPSDHIPVYVDLVYVLDFFFFFCCYVLLLWYLALNLRGRGNRKH